MQTAGAAVNAVLAPRVWGSVRWLAFYQISALALGLGMYALFVLIRRREQKAFVEPESSTATA